jgi:hypothetical protein
MVAVGWVEERKPTVTRVMLGFAKLNPTYQNMSLSAVLSVSQNHAIAWHLIKLV